MRAVHRLYPVFLMKALCFALFACAFNLLLGYGGLLSFGHAMFFGTGRLRQRRTPLRSGACRPNSASCGTAAAAALGVVIGGSRSAARASISP